jgi:hypothetical protein
MKITASKFITYDVDAVMETIADLNGISVDEVNLAEAMDLIYGWAYEDFKGDMDNVFFLDEDGTDVQQLGLM